MTSEVTEVIYFEGPAGGLAKRSRRPDYEIESTEQN